MARFPHPEQRKYAQRSYAGTFRLSGGAGTGKTVVLLHRARMLARREPGSRILLTTFTTNLADQLRTDLDGLDPGLPHAPGLGEPGVSVHGIDALASAVLRRAGADVAEDAEAVLGVATTQTGGRTPGTGWRDALDAAGGGLPAALQHSVPGRRIRPSGASGPDHQPGDVLQGAAPRAGRSPGPGQAGRVGDVIEAYRAQARIAGSVDFLEAATIAAVHLRRVAEVGAQYVADHVLVDEGQDLGPAHWQLLRALAGEHAADLFIAGDSYQRIYGRRVVLSASGIRIVGRSQRLTLNYRTTAQNLAYAINVLEGGAYVDLESDQESTARYRSARSGPVPRLIACATLTEELDRAADLVRTWVAETGAPETIAVLVREQRQRNRLVSGLAERGVTIRAVNREHVKPGQPVAMTMHRAKGNRILESPAVRVSTRGPHPPAAAGRAVRRGRLDRRAAARTVPALRGRDPSPRRARPVVERRSQPAPT